MQLVNLLFYKTVVLKVRSKYVCVQVLHHKTISSTLALEHRLTLFKYFSNTHSHGSTHQAEIKKQCVPSSLWLIN